MTHVAAYLLGPGRLEMRRVETPAPGAGELLAAVEAATTCGTDLKVYLRGGHPRMLEVPTAFGHEWSGRVEAVGEGVEGWRRGDPICVANSAPCGQCPPCQGGRENLCEDMVYLNGAFAERILVPARFVERSAHRRPEGLAPSVAALAEPLACVLHGVERTVDDEPRDGVVFGAGPIGLLFVHVLAAAGHRVLLADPNPSRLAGGEELGAAATLQIDRDAPLAAQVRERHPAGLDFAVDATGSPAVWAATVEVVRPGGRVNLFGGCAPGSTVTFDATRLHYAELEVRGTYHYRPRHFAQALARLASGELDSDVLLSGERPLGEAAEALESMRRREALKIVLRP